MAENDEIKLCMSCGYWKQIIALDGAPQPLGECRCYPPSVYEEAGRNDARWPLTRPDHWCGFWHERPEWWKT